MQEYEDAQAAMEEIEDQAEQDDADAEAAGARHANALAAMEECLGQRTECSVAYAAAKAVSQEKRSQIIRELLENHKPTSPESPSSERASLAMDDDDNEKGIGKRIGTLPHRRMSCCVVWRTNIDVYLYKGRCLSIE